MVISVSARSVLAAQVAIFCISALLAAADEQCSIQDASCVPENVMQQAPVEVAAEEMLDAPLASLALVLAMLVIVTVWLMATVKFALDGSLPARLAIWGLLPEAYAAVSVGAVKALLRLKKGPTPVIMLQNCVTDEGALQLSEAVREFGQSAELQALELPQNPQLGLTGLKYIVEACLTECSQVVELDLSFNPQLGDTSVPVLRQLLENKDSKFTALRLAYCGLTATGGAKSLVSSVSTWKLRTLDLSCCSFAGSPEAVAALGDAPFLEELILKCCSLGVTEVAALAEQLPYTSIKSLQLGGNGFGSAGVAALAPHLPESLVEELGLEGNEIEAGCEGLAALGTAWAKRPFPRLRLSGNKMTTDEIQSFVRTLKMIHG